MMLYLSLLALSSLAALTDALEVTNGSSCASVCDGPGSTLITDLTCNDGGYTRTTNGATMRACLTCESTSTEDQGELNNDVYWFLFNMKYTVQVCVFDNTGDTAAIPSCNAACAPVKPVFETLWLEPPQLPLYDYCSINGSAFVQYASSCASCLQGFAGSVVLGNFINAMQSACDTKPDASKGQKVSIKRDLFDLSIVASASSTSSASATSAQVSTTGSAAASIASAAGGAASTSSLSTDNGSSSGGGLNSGAAAGIGVACGIAGILAILGLAWFIYRRRHRNGTAASQETPLPSCKDQDLKPETFVQASSLTDVSEAGGQQYFEMDGSQTSRGRSSAAAIPEMEASEVRAK